MKLARAVFVVAFAAVLLASAAVVAFDLYSALTLSALPPGKMSVLSYIGLKDLQRGSLSTNALNPSVMLAYLVALAGFRDIGAIEGAAILSTAALPLAGGVFGYVATKSKLAGGASAILLAVLPISYLPALGGDYAFAAALSLVQFTVLFSLLFTRSARVPMAIVWLGFSVASAALAGLAMAPAAWLLFLTSASWAAWCLFSKRRVTAGAALAPGVAGLAANLIAAPIDPGEALRLVSPAANFTQDIALVAILGAAGAAGAVSLCYRLRVDAIPPVAFAGLGLLLASIYGPEALLLAYPGLVILAMSLLLEFRGMLRTVREEGPPGKEPVVIEIGFEKVIAAVFAVLMLASPLVVGIGPGSAIQGASYLGNEQIQTINQVGALGPSAFGPGTVAAPSSIAPWLNAEFGVNTLPALNPDQAATADALTSTSFRLRSPYLMADEWTPYSSVRTPIIYAYDGAAYQQVLHLDDGTNLVNLTLGGRSLAETTGGMFMSSHAFAQNATALSLTLQLSRVGFNITKQLSMSKVAPDLMASYYVSPSYGGTLSSMTLLVYVDTPPTSPTVRGDSITFTLSVGQVTLTFPGGSTPKFVPSEAGNYVVSTFLAKSGTIDASVRVGIEGVSSSGEVPFYSSLPDVLANGSLSSLLTFNPTPGLNFLGGSISNSSYTLDSKDVFDTVLLNLNGTNYTEAPAYARVVSQSVSNSSCDATVAYATAGLNITKSVASSGDSLDMSYAIKPAKNGETLKSMNMTFWVPWQRALLGYHVSNGSVSLLLDSGPVVLTPSSGEVTGILVGPDPLYGQFRVMFEFALNPTSGNAGVSMQFGSHPSCQNFLTSRPVMSGSDELRVYSSSGEFRPAFTNDVFTVYDVVPGESAP